MILRLQETDYRPSRWTELDRMNRRVNRLLDEITSPKACAYPLVNVRTNEEGAIVTAELPGMRREEIDVSVIGSAVTIKGNKKVEDAGNEAAHYLRRERRSGEFERTLHLPKRIDRDRVDARYEHGVLTVTAPWNEEERSSKIRVN